MFKEELSKDIIIELQHRYTTSKNLKLDFSLIKEILDIIEINQYKILPSFGFPTQNFSATALSYFENIIKSWMKIEGKHTVEFTAFIPSEQILRDLIDQGWIIRPPEGI